jgi:selenocysteine lyase/cysteine desulfurase
MNEIIYDEDDQMTCDKIRQTVGDFVGAGVDEITINTNTTEGLGWAANGLELQPDDEVITTLHFDPYNSCWQILRDRGLITLIELELPTPAKNKDEIIASFEKAITPKTKVMTFCHINFSTGLRMPVKELCQLAKEHGIITVVDGAHAIGMIDFSLHDLGCDIYAGSLHKWICGPPGAGFFYIRKDMQDKVWPIEFDSYMGKGIKIFMNFQLRGQQCTPAYAGVLNAIELQNTIGKDRIEVRVMALHNYCKGKLKEIYGEDKLFSPAGDELSTGLCSFNPFDDPHEGVGGGKISSLYYGLYFKENNKKKNITTRSISFKDKLTDSLPKKALRISTHIYNNYDEIDSTIEIIQELVTNIKNGATYGPPK